MCKKFSSNKYLLTNINITKFSSYSIIPCESFEYHPEYHSVITTFDLVCTKNILVSLTQFFHLFGVLWGGIIATRLLESISPKNVMLAGMYSQIFCGKFSSNFLQYCFFFCYWMETLPYVCKIHNKNLRF